MSEHVIVTFHMEVDDPDHPMGLSVATYERVVQVVSSLGGENVEAEKVEDDE